MVLSQIKKVVHGMIRERLLPSINQPFWILFFARASLAHLKWLLFHGGCPGVPVHGGIPIVFISIRGVVTQFVNVSFLRVLVHEDTTISRKRFKER